MKNCLKICVWCLVFGVWCFLPNFVLAENVISEGQIGRLEQKKENVKERVEKRIENRCEQITSIITNKLQRFEDNKQKHVDRYNRVKARLQDIADKLEEKGYDVSKLRVHLNEFDEMVQNYAGLYVEFIEILENTQNYACGESQGDFKDAMLETKEQLKTVREARHGIREFYKSVIREDIKNLRNQAENESK